MASASNTVLPKHRPPTARRHASTSHNQVLYIENGNRLTYPPFMVQPSTPRPSRPMHLLWNGTTELEGPTECMKGVESQKSAGTVRTYLCGRPPLFREAGRRSVRNRHVLLGASRHRVCTLRKAREVLWVLMGGRGVLRKRASEGGSDVQDRGRGRHRGGRGVGSRVLLLSPVQAGAPVEVVEPCVAGPVASQGTWYHHDSCCRNKVLSCSPAPPAHRHIRFRSPQAIWSMWWQTAVIQPLRCRNAISSWQGIGDSLSDMHL